MKPNTQLSLQSIHLDREGSSFRGHQKQPRIDYHFRTPQEEPHLRSSANNHKQTKSELSPKFSELTSSVFGIHAKKEFIAEAVLFSVIIAISALPIAVAIYILY